MALNSSLPWVAGDGYQSLPSAPSSYNPTKDNNSLDPEELTRLLRYENPKIQENCLLIGFQLAGHAHGHRGR